MNSVRPFGPEAKIAMGVNFDTSPIKAGQNEKSYTRIFIGNIHKDASMEKIEKFLGDMRIVSFKLLNRKNRSFAFVNLPTVHEAEKAVKMYNNKEFMGHKLTVRLADKQNENVDILSEMPTLEDIDDDDDNDDDEITSQCDSQMNMTCTDKKIYHLNIQPDSSGLFSLCINKKNSCFMSEKDIMEKLCPFGPISSISFSSNSVIVKMPLKQQVINCFKALSKELNMSLGENPVRKNHNKINPAKIYIGNIALEASKAKILNFLSDVKITTFKLINKKTKVFAFADLLNVQEAEKAIKLYNNVIFMGHKLIVRLTDNQNNNASSVLGEMPKLEDIEDDYDESFSASNSNDDNLKNGKSYNSKRNPVPMPKLEDIEPEKIDPVKNCFENPLNIQPDSKGLFSLCINKTDSYLKSKAVLEQIFSPYGPISSVSFKDDGIVIKMASRQQAINSLKVLGQELNMSVVDNSVDNNSVKSSVEESYTKIYIGNIALKASRVEILTFLCDVKIANFKIISKKNKVFAFADLLNIQEAEKAIKYYNNVVFMGHKLVVRLANDQNEKVSSILGEMPKLEDIEDDYDESFSASNSNDDNLKNGKSYNSKRIPVPMPKLEDIEPEKIDHVKNSSLSSGSGKYDKRTSRMLTNDLTTSQDNSTIKHIGQPTEFEDQVTLFVGNFPVGMSKEQLFTLFQDFHPSSVHIINNQNSKRSTQAFVRFRSKKDSERAVYKFDKTPCENGTLLVTSIGFCPCLEEQKSERISKASSYSTLTPESICNGSSSPEKKFEYQSSLSVNHHHQQHHHQQQRRSSQLTDSLTNVNKKTFLKNPQKNNMRIKMPEHNQQMKEENQKLTIEEPFKSEAAKMEILIKKFKIQPNLSSSDSFQVMITSVINNELFWGNIFYSDKDLTEFMFLHKELQSAALSWPKYVLLKKEMKCIALYQGEWYRAWVLNSIEEDMVEVFFLDYGNVSQIKLEYVRSPSESMWKLLPKARVFKIANDSKKLPPNAENQLFQMKVSDSENMTNDYIAVASLVSH